MIAFRVHGQPAPKGSFRISAGKGRTRQGKRRITVRSDSPKTDAWAEAVAWTAKRAMEGRPPHANVPLRINVVFYMPPPKRKKNALPMTKPDVDKLLRATLDPMEGLVFDNDSRVVAADVYKVYASETEPPGAYVAVEEML